MSIVNCLSPQQAYGAVAVDAIGQQGDHLLIRMLRSDIPCRPISCTGGDATGDAQITMEEISAATDSFNYEFMCGISRRVPRYYCAQGQVVRSVYYLLAEE